MASPDVPNVQLAESADPASRREPPQGDRPCGGPMGGKRRGMGLSWDGAQKLVTLLLSGAELAVQLIDVISHIHG